MSRGRFIAFEGGEGMGKSTQAKLLIEELARRSIVAEQTREPGGTEGGEAIRKLLLAPPGGAWGREAEALLFAAARSDHVAQKITPALEAGKWVICDRYVDSSRAYQGAAGGLGDEAIMRLHAFGSRGLLPDLTLVFVLPEASARERLQARDGDASDAIGGRSSEYHRAVNEAFVHFAAAQPGRFAVINGEGTPDEVHQRVMQALSGLLPDPCS